MKLVSVMNFYHFDSTFELAILYWNKMSEQMKLHVDLLSVILVLQQVCFFGAGVMVAILAYDFEDATSNSLVV